MKNLSPYRYIAIILFFSIKSLAQQDYSVVHFTGDNGLPQNSIKSIAADSYGFIWLATEDGLVRFDGRQFYVYNKSNLDIPDNRVLFIHRTKRALSQSNAARNQTCVVDFLDDTTAIKIENGIAVRDTVYDRTRKKHIQFLYDEPGQLIEAKDAPDNIGIQFPFKRYMVSAGADDENFYVCDNVKIKYYKHWKMQYQVPFSSKDLWNFFSLKEQLYYFNQNEGIIVKIFSGKIQRMPLSGEIKMDPAYASDKKNIRLIWNHNSDQAFLTLRKNLYFLKKGEDGSITTQLLVGNFDLRSREIKQIHYDIIAKKVFLGSATQGLYILTKKQFKVLDSKNLFPNNVFYGQLPYNNNAIVTPRGDLVGIAPLTNKVIDSKVNAFTLAPANDERMMLRDFSGNIWVRSNKQLIQKDSLAKKVLRTISFSNEIKAICQKKDKWLWCGVLYDGLYRVDTSNPNSIPEPILKNSTLKMTYLIHLSDNELLMGTTKGLYRVNTISRKLKLVEGTNNIFIKSIHVAGQNQFWITALEKGLMLLTKEYKVIMFPLDKNRYLASAHCVINDGNGYLWVTTNRGLFQMSTKDLIHYAQFKITNSDKTTSESNLNNKKLQSTPELFYTYHTMDEGFKTNEFNGSCMPCAVKLPNGNISLPSINGLVWFKPGLINNNYLPNDSILVDRLEVNQSAVKIVNDTLRLPLAPKNIRIYFTTAYFGNNYNLNISYALLKDKQATGTIDWVTVDNEDLSIRYSSIESGHYVLLIRKMNGFGPNNIQIKKVYLDVPPFWYETAWARVSISFVFFFLLAATIYLYNKYRLRSIEIENTRLEGLVLDRTTDLMDTLKRLEQSKTEMSGQIYTMSRVLTSITHDIQSPLKYIAFSSGHVPNIIKNGQFEEAVEITTSISDMSNRMSVLLGDLLDYIRVHVYGKGVQSEEIQIRNLIEDKIALFNSLIHKNGSLVVNQVSEDLIVSSDYLLFSIIIHNLLDNASKYTYNGIIDISCRTISQHKTELIIANTGSGISKEIVNMMNSSGKDSDTEIKVKDKKVSGLGLLIVKEIADLLNISIQLTQTNQTNFHLLFENKPSPRID